MGGNNTYNLTNPQKSIWQTEQFYKNTSIENISGRVNILEKVDFKKFIKAINLCIKRNDSFRLKFFIENDEVKQFVEDYSEFSFEKVLVDSEKDVKKIENELANMSFETLNSYLFKFVLYEFKDGHGGFIVTLHHLISDAWSSGFLLSEIIDIYDSLKNNEELSLEESPSYVEYINSEQEYLNSDKFIKDKEYWNNLFSAVPEIATIPSLKSTSTSSKAKRKQFVLNKSLMNIIHEYCKKYKVSEFNFFMAVLSIYLGRVSSLDEFVIGTPILNRSNFKEKHTSGMFISVIPFKISIQDLAFSDFVSNISKDFLSIFRHQKYPYQTLLEDIRKEHGSNIPNLYNVMFSYQNMRSNKQTAKTNYETNWIFSNNISDDLDVHLYDINDTGDNLIAYDFKVDKYDIEDIYSIHARILYIINQILENENINIKDIEIVTPDEKKKLLYDFNNTKLDYEKDKTIAELFQEQVLKTPDNIAVVFEDKQLTYKELNEKANSLAEFLREQGIDRNDMIGIMVPRSLEMIVAILAILKAGGCYVPIDPEYPQDRIEYMLDNSNAKLLLSFESLKNKVNFEKTVYIELDKEVYNLSKANLDSINKSDDLAYVIYTSGSTGKPKGVMISNKNVNNFIQGMCNKINFAKSKTIVCVTTISFDIFVLETLLPLLKGLKIVIANEDEQNDANLFNKLCIENNVKIVQTTPSRFQILINNSENPEFLNKVSDILVGGEPLPKNLFEKFKKQTKANIYNVYGPTETTVWSTVKDLTNESNITIGQPIANTTCYILDNNKKMLPCLTPGNLYIGGDGLSKGYLNNNELTSSKFIKSPFDNNELIYDTGDIAYIDYDGELIHMGRNDFQVKVNGHRIELEEIENAILKNKEIKNCVVAKKTSLDNREFLCAYFISNKDIDISQLRSLISKELPIYMVPQHFIKLDEFPYTPNGKIDRKKLPLPDNSANNKKKIVGARNDIDNNLINILQELLEIENISIDDSFFELGGDSLSAINLCAKIYSEFNVQLFAKDIMDNPVIQELSDLIASKNANTSPVQHSGIVSTQKAPFYPVSTAQRRIYYSTIIDGNNSILYNLPNIIIFNSQPNINKLNSCFNALIKRHASLRTSFEIENNDVVQKIVTSVNFNLEIQNCDEENVDKLIKEFVKPFDLSVAPLMRAKLIITKNKCMLLFDMHHIISDGTSLSILVTELCKMYSNQVLPEINIDYKDYAVWETKNLKTEYFRDAEKYWLNQFSDEIPVLNLPTNPRPAIKSYDGDKVYFNVDKALSTKIYNLSNRFNASPYMILLSAYYILLSKYCGQNDLVVGTPVANRNFDELKNIIGMFVNSLPIRMSLDNTMSYSTFLNEVKNKCLNCYNYGSYPFDELVNKLHVSRDASRTPLFDTMFIYQTNGYTSASFDGKNVNYFIPNSHTSKFDLSLEVIPNHNKFDLSFEYCTKLFDKSFIENLSEHYINIIKSILENQDNKIADIDMLSNKERNKIIYEFNKTDMDYPKDKTITMLFEEQVNKTPNEIAVVFEDQKITFKELNEKANSLAYYLRNHIKIKRDDIVGIMLPRSIDVIVAMLAVVKSGGAYIPIDPTFPNNRVSYMLKNSNAKILLTNHKTNNMIDYPYKLQIDFENSEIYNQPSENIESINMPGDLVYTIYTSGSTGNPKGVMITHQVLSNFTYYCNNYVKYLKDTKHHNMASITTISFDIFAYETLISLQKGLTVVLANENEQTTPSLLNELMIKNNVDIIQSTPSIMQIFVNNKEDMPALKNLKFVVLAGEQLPLSLVNILHKIANITVYNGYGPSETYYCTLAEMNDKLITIGKPIYNSQMYILDKNMNPLPVGVVGDIYISGECVGRGYLNNPELTKKSFISNPFIPGITMYRSGDLGKYLEDGNIICLGRLDHQVKIRGLRIELEEIEAVLAKYPHVSKVAVVKQTVNNREFISAYFVSDKRIAANTLRNHLSKHLPKYMVPSYYISLDDLPYTPNGKIDKKALPLPKMATNNAKNFVPAKTDIEKKLVELWEKILNIKPIGINDNFFELGGDSLLAMNLNLELSKITNKIKYQDIFQFPTIAELETIIESNQEVELYEKVENIPINVVNVLAHTKDKYKFVNQNLNNVLLTGSTGFLGIHVLNELLNIEKIKIYCIIRKEPGITSEQKLLQKLNYYYGHKYDGLINKRIFVVTGDICKENFGMSQPNTLEIINSVDVIINCAANVAHFGNYDKFYKTNVLSVKHMINFCKKYNKKLYHISTMGVAGISLDSSLPSDKKKNNVSFDESSLYIGQKPETVYTYTKFQAEVEVLNEIPNGLDAYILRMGNLMPRYSDGLFQDNIEENEFINKIVSFAKIGAIPSHLIRYSLEFTPVDYAAKAICKIITHPSSSNRIFHVFDDKRVPVLTCIRALRKFKYSIDILNETEFVNKIVRILNNDNTKESLEFILNDFDENKHISYEANMNVKSDFTKKYLKRIGFSWPKITQKYLNSFIKILRRVI